MKMNAALQVIESEGFDNAISATVVAGPALFKLLSGLYSSPIRAIVRELVANAVDAQADAGHPNQPIEIHAPTRLEPSFRVIDNGPGLSEARVSSLMLGYGGTTKDLADDRIGGFGIGSKSPLCYTDNFTIISRYGHFKNTFIVFLDETQCPKIAKVDAIPYVGPNGIEVCVPVKPSDVYKFESEIQYVLGTFPVQPITATPIQQLEYVFKTDEFGIRTDNHSISGVRAIIGHIAYPVSGYIADLPEPDGRNYARHTALTRANIDLFLPIGAVVIAPSREALIYTPRTQTVLNDALSVVETTLRQKVKEDLDAISTEWGRYTLVGSITANLRLPTEIIVPDEYRKYHVTNPAEGIFAEADLSNQLNYLIRVSTGRRSTLFRPNTSLHHAASKITFVDCTGIAQAAICRTINTATTMPEEPFPDYVFFSIDKLSTVADDIRNEVLAGAPVIPWADFHKALNPLKAPTAQRSASVKRYYKTHIDCPENACEIDATEHAALTLDTQRPVVFSFQKKLYRDPECEYLVENYVATSNAKRAYQMQRALFPDRPHSPDILVVKKGKVVPNPTLEQWTETKTAELRANPHFQELLQVVALCNDSGYPRQRIYCQLNTNIYEAFQNFLCEQGFPNTPFAAMATYLTKNYRLLTLIKDAVDEYRNPIEAPSPIELDTPFNQACQQLTAAYPDFIANLEIAGSYGRSYLNPAAMADYLVMATERFNQTLSSTI
jgi:hypothetical protein